ncbi:MAG TPA: hypothetical protein VMB25_24165 [Bryobacteraceae bacterium]|nr:hypothetical protein [Bryobacteraceae bacterium]
MPNPNSWLPSAAIVAALGLLVQGIKSGWDLIMSLKSHHNTQNGLRLQEVNALMNLVAGLPLAEARRTVWKVKLVKLIRDKAPMQEVYGSLEELIAEVTGGSASEAAASGGSRH